MPPDPSTFPVPPDHPAFLEIHHPPFHPEGAMPHPGSTSFHPHPQPPLICSMANGPQLTAEEMDIKPRPHPHLPDSTLYISHVPPDMDERSIAQALRECMPIRIKLELLVPAKRRIQPDAYYQWMPQTGTLTFDDMYNVEKAMAILPYHPNMVETGIMVSPYVNAFLPLPTSRGRYIRPTKRVWHVPSLSSDSTDLFMSRCPTPGELFDAIRPWGTIHQVRVWMEPISYEGTPGNDQISWAGRVEFWHEDEARRLEVGFGQSASHIKGWQVTITREPIIEAAYFPHFAPGPQSSLPTIANALSAEENFARPPPLILGAFASYQHYATTPLKGSHASLPQVPFPDTLPPLTYTPPWSAHNPYTIHGTDLPDQAAPLPPVLLPLSPPHESFKGLPQSPVTPLTSFSASTVEDIMMMKQSHSNKAGMENSRKSKHRNWSVTLDEGPNGEIRPTGFVADDGMVIQHGPGQHIRPAPAFGPGSSSSSGLVDYSNVFVKNLDPDINSQYLSDLFSEAGKIISARVMRDSMQRSRGYGFVSFHTPEEAAKAIRLFDGTQVGNSLLAVTLHEPRKLRPDKIAERVAMGVPTAYGRGNNARRTVTPVRGRVLQQAEGPKQIATTDELRSLSPDSRKEALLQKVVPIVATYARVHSVPDQCCGPAARMLAEQDLALIPLLHNPGALKAKIEETFSIVQHSPDLDTSSDDDRPSTPHSAVLGAVSSLDQGSPRPGSEDSKQSISKAQVNLTSIEDDRSIVERNVGSNEHTTAIDQENIGYSSAESSPLPGAESCTALELKGLPFERLELDSVNLDDLLALSSRDIISILRGAKGDKLLAKLGFESPNASQRSSVESWARRTISKQGVERKMEMAAFIAKKMNSAALKKSQKTKSARALVNSETDDEALCHLTAYPYLIEGKVKKVMAEPDRRSTL